MDATNYIAVGTQLLGEPALACPVCGFEYIHPVELECRSPGTAKGCVIINADGVNIDPCPPPEGRGTRITLRFVGECSHAFEYVLHFHKGNTMVFRSMRDLLDDKQAPNTIWRD